MGIGWGYFVKLPSSEQLQPLVRSCSAFSWYHLLSLSCGLHTSISINALLCHVHLYGSIRRREVMRGDRRQCQVRASIERYGDFRFEVETHRLSSSRVPHRLCIRTHVQCTYPFVFLSHSTSACGRYRTGHDRGLSSSTLGG